MPTYSYACKTCAHAFDVVQSFSDESLTVCPECEGTLRKRYGTVGVTFNGSGFYRTDSRASAGTSAGESASSTSAAPSAAPASTSPTT
ncbi:MAG: FmdB family zinc ribbon protein [Candidatus Microbacterium stercoravium]|uniref:FmdB family transcriptional regulator n=1 Tax=Candidatus Microbacterium stercoravium TaxID=2838697 RepID=A0A9D2H6Q9_9MICO|nr:FmdB family transcriptional regulator [Candidatus Microbacterium stercoravium]